ncbi:MAG: chloride channel protein [Bacteroidetes bacterium]|nr:chloride channel protein [Bacteroidota bacterium]
MNYQKLNVINIVINKIHTILTEKQFLIFSSILVGLSAGIAAVVLKLFVHGIRHLILEGFFEGSSKYFYLLFPVIGIGITVFLIKPLFKNDVNVGSVNILHSIAKKGSFLPFEQIYSHIITSGLTVGFGGSAGLESPIVSTGSAIGSNYSRVNKLNYKERTLLLAAGAAGGISGAFNAPIAGVLFALEVILVDISITAFIPLLIASVSGALISSILLKEDILLSFQNLAPFNYHNVPFYILLAIIAGITSIYYVNVFHFLESFYEKLRSKMLRWVLGGVFLIIMVFVFPSLFGEGYESIKLLATNSAPQIFKNSPLYLAAYADWALLILLTIVMLIKVFAASATIGSGGVGGNFAPSLFVGAYLGYVFSLLFKLIGINLPMSNFTLVAMAGILSGVFHAPLTSIFLIAEISGGYALIVPLMIVASISYVIVKFFHPESMDIRKLKLRGTIVSENKDISILGRIEVLDLIEKDFSVLHPEESLGKVIEHIKHTRRNIFPVVNKKNKLLGIVQLDNIREEMFDTKLYEKITAKDIMEKVSAKISSDESIFSAMKKFDETGQWNLPVVKDGIYLGFLSKSSVLSRYRHELIDSFN